MMFTSTQSDQIHSFLNPLKSCCIIIHRNPDGDALGSSLGLKNYLKEAYSVDAQVIAPDSFPEFLSWMPKSESILIAEKEPENAKALLNNADIIFCLDFNHPSRVGDLSDVLSAAKGFKVMIDHHQNPDSFCNATFSKTSASSTCEMVTDWILQDKGEIFLTTDAAKCLYTGIMTDTGSFRFQATTSHTHKLASLLLSKGIDHWLIHESLMNQNSLSKLKLWGHILSQSLELIPEYHAAFIKVSAADLDKYGYVEGDLEGLVNYALSIKGTKLAAIFSERGGKIRISFRSIGDFKVNEFSGSHFGGGGHINAAGGVSGSSLDDTIRKFKDVLSQYPELQNKS
jgi:bifunctional oligoribonuclease and PAP phosphatase NrnA